MKVDRLNLDNDQIEQMECIGIVRFVGESKDVDLTDGKDYYVVGFHDNLLKIIDNSQDYYYYLPFDAHDIGKKEGIVSGFLILEDHTGKITELFDSYKIEFDLKQKKNAKKLVNRIIQWKLRRNSEYEK